MEEKVVVVDDAQKNLKAELDRKLGNFEEKVKALESTNASLAAKLAEVARPKIETAPARSLRERFYEDEEGTLRDLKKEAKEEAKQEMLTITQAQTEAQIELGRLNGDYPELADASSDFTKKSVEIHGKLVEGLRGTAIGYRMAVREAAAELGVLPKAKRPKLEDDEGFILNGKGGGSMSGREKKGKELTDSMLAFAEALDRPVDDEKYLERLKKAAGRDSWTKYRNPRKTKKQ